MMVRIATAAATPARITGVLLFGTITVLMVLTGY